MPRPKSTTAPMARISLTLRTDQLERLTRLGVACDRSASWLLRDMLDAMLVRREYEYAPELDAVTLMEGE